MATAKYLTKRLIEPLERKRREELELRFAEGMERERRAWTQWNSRRMEAEADGLPFDEPPPSG